MKIAKPKASEFHTCFGPHIAAHWAEAFPAECDELRRSGRLASEADRKADQAAEYVSDALERGEPFELAAEVAEVFWNRPPNAPPAAAVDPSAPPVENQSVPAASGKQGRKRPKGWLQ